MFSTRSACYVPPQGRPLRVLLPIRAKSFSSSLGTSAPVLPQCRAAGSPSIVHRLRQPRNGPPPWSVGQAYAAQTTQAQTTRRESRSGLCYSSPRNAPSVRRSLCGHSGRTGGGMTAGGRSIARYLRRWLRREDRLRVKITMTITGWSGRTRVSRRG